MPRRKRRSKGSGSVYKVKRKGWCAQRELPHGAEGKRRYERRFFELTAAGKAAALRQVAQWETEQEALAHHVRAGDTVRAWCQHWLTTKVGVVEETTLAYYKRHLEYATAHVGDHRLLDLTAQDIRELLAALAGEDGAGLSPRSRAHVRTVLGMALQLAVNDGVIARNPIDAVEAPKVPRFEAVALSDAQLAALFAAVAGTRLEAMWHLLADLGMRLDELLSTHWANLDRAARTLRIRATKTDTERYVPLTDEHLQLLADHWERLQIERADNPRWKEHGYLIPSEVGTKLLQSNARRVWKQTIDGINDAEAQLAAEEGRPARVIIPRSVRIHDLRHTAATNLIAAGNDIPTVQYITGHRDSAVLLEIYAHHQEERNRAAVERVTSRRKGA